MCHPSESNYAKTGAPLFVFFMSHCYPSVVLDPLHVASLQCFSPFLPLHGSLNECFLYPMSSPSFIIIPPLEMQPPGVRQIPDIPGSRLI